MNARSPCCYPESLLPQMEFRDLAQVLIRAYSPAAAILAGAKWELDGDELHVHLAANGKAALAPHLPKGEAFLQELFGVRKTLVLHSATELEGKALFAETERIRQEAIKNSPAVAVAAAAVQKKKGRVRPVRFFQQQRRSDLRPSVWRRSGQNQRPEP